MSLPPSLWRVARGPLSGYPRGKGAPEVRGCQTCHHGNSAPEKLALGGGGDIGLPLPLADAARERRPLGRLPTHPSLSLDPALQRPNNAQGPTGRDTEQEGISIYATRSRFPGQGPETRAELNANPLASSWSRACLLGSLNTWEGPAPNLCPHTSPPCIGNPLHFVPPKGAPLSPPHSAMPCDPTWLTAPKMISPL